MIIYLSNDDNVVEKQNWRIRYRYVSTTGNLQVSAPDAATTPKASGPLELIELSAAVVQRAHGFAILINVPFMQK